MSHLLFHLTLICSPKIWGKKSLLEQACALDLARSYGHDGRRDRDWIVQVCSHRGCHFMSSDPPWLHCLFSAQLSGGGSESLLTTWGERKAEWFDGCCIINQSCYLHEDLCLGAPPCWLLHTPSCLHECSSGAKVISRGRALWPGLGAWSPSHGLLDRLLRRPSVGGHHEPQNPGLPFSEEWGPKRWSSVQYLHKILQRMRQKILSLPRH